MRRISRRLIEAALIACWLFAGGGAAQTVSEQFMETYRAYDKAFNDGDIERAIELATETLALGRKELGADHDKTAVLEINLAHVLMLAGKFKEAESLFVNARKILEAQHGPSDPTLETVFRDLGEMYMLQARFEEARRQFAAAVELMSETSAADDPKVAELLLKLGAVEAGLDDTEAAHQALQRALEIRKAKYGARDFRTADVVFQQGMLDSRTGGYASAAEFYRAALAIYEQVLEPRDPRILKAHSELAICYEALHDPQKYAYHSDQLVSLIEDAEGDARALIIVQPAFPEIPEGVPSQGWVLLEYDVTADGRVSNPRVLEGENQQLFADAALAATEKWRFKPRMEDGKRLPQAGMRARLDFNAGEITINVGTVE
jgi:TonB family protein